jgi:hypothetical protein
MRPSLNRLALTTLALLSIASCSTSPAATSGPIGSTTASPALTPVPAAASLTDKAPSAPKVADNSSVADLPSALSSNLLSPPQIAELAKLSFPALAPTNLPAGFSVVGFKVERGQYANGDDDSGYSIRYAGPGRTCLTISVSKDGPRGPGLRTAETSFGPVKIYRETLAASTSMYGYIQDQRSIYVGTRQDADCNLMSDTQFDQVMESMGQIQAHRTTSQRQSPQDTPEDRTRRLEVARQLDKDLLILRNPNRTITVRGMQAWSGKNGTGDLGYESCDVDGKCLKLQGGKMSCSRGTCGMSWTNGDYGYGLTVPMTNPDRPDPKARYTLTVVQGGRVILEEDGLTSIR